MIHRLEVPATKTDRSSGDIHPGGNPHFFSDPLSGLRVARLLRDRFTRLRPRSKAVFARNYASFREKLCSAMVGPELAKLYDHDAGKLAILFARGKLVPVLKAQGDAKKLAGWFGSMLPLRGTALVADHDLWPYFASRFGVRVIGFFEPKPGVAPTTSHLERLIKQMKADKVKAILSAPYFAPQHAEFVSRATGARIATMAHQVRGRAGCDDYIAFIDHDVRAVVDAVKARQ